jgi:LuxR family transcriptional regulator, maltose regulon positive regulatory protein
VGHRHQNALVAQSTGEDSGAVARDEGWADLAGGRWSAARDCFERAIAASDAADAYEGLSWAAWWLDDADVVFAARERAYRLYKRDRDATAAARMATWLACDELDFHGAFAVANGWLGRARRLLDGVEPGSEHGWLAFFEGYMASVAGDAETTVNLAIEAAAIGRRLDVPDLEMLGLALEGATLVAAAKVDDGMRRLDEATAAALTGDAAVPIAGAWACCFLVTACSAVRDYERASEWCDRIADFAGRYGSRYMLAFCRAEYGVVHLWQGRWREAESVLAASLEDFSRSRPAMTGGSLRALAELRRRQGRLEEAAQLLDQAGPSPAAQLVQARIALDRGKSVQAIELVERMLRQLPEHRRLDRAPALEVLVGARIARGEFDEAQAALESLLRIAQLVGTAPMHASTRLAEGQLAAARGDHETAKTHFEDAVDGFARAGGRYDAARARLELATSLLAMERAGAARAEAAAAEVDLRELGALPEAKRSHQLVQQRSMPGPVTPREAEVLALLAAGLTNREIAERLVVSEHTVHRHVTNILRKLDLPSRAAAAAHAVREGLVDPRGG